MQEKSSLKFSERLAAEMRRAGVRAARLAEKSRISKGYVSELLKGTKDQPSVEVCAKFADVLGISLARLLGEEEAEPPPPAELPPLASAAHEMALAMSAMTREMAEMRRRLAALEALVRERPGAP